MKSKLLVLNLYKNRGGKSTIRASVPWRIHLILSCIPFGEIHG